MKTKKAANEKEINFYVAKFFSKGICLLERQEQINWIIGANISKDVQKEILKKTKTKGNRNEKFKRKSIL